MTALTATVAAYASFSDAQADWVDLNAAAANGSIILVDAALIERTNQRVTVFHRCSSAGWGRGAIASALAAVLWPPAMVVGALAGGVGGHMITALSSGTPRATTQKLGEAMDGGPFVALAVVSGEHGAPPPWNWSCQSVTMPIEVTELELLDAIVQDEADAMAI